MKCKFCNKDVYYGILKDSRIFFNSDDMHVHRCKEYYQAKNKIPDAAKEDTGPVVDIGGAQ
jgi:hypothetical protein